MAGNLAKAVYTSDKDKMLANLAVEALKLSQRLDNGRNYLMGTKPDKITIEDCLEAFGFTKDGFEPAE